MKRNIVIIYSVFFLTFISCQNDNGNSASSAKLEPCSFIVTDSLWTILVNNGKDMNVRLSDITPTTKLLDSVVEIAMLIDPELNFSIKSNAVYAAHFRTDSLTLDSIGRWQDYEVYYISNEFVMFRSVLLKDCTGRLRMLYTESDHVGSPYSGTEIYDENSGEKLDKAKLHKLLLPSLELDSINSILKLKHYVGGNKEYWSGIRWKINTATKIPELDLSNDHK